MSEILPTENIQQKIFLIRGVKVMLDTDLAQLYGVPMKRLNEQVKRNNERFPGDFMFQLRSQERDEVVANCDHLKNLRFSHQLPYAFTEHGIAMLSSVLRSPRAVQVNILIVRVFIRLREMLVANKDLAAEIEALKREQELQNKHINHIWSTLNKMLTEPPKTKGRMGFESPKTH